ncbi:hypothetical protein HMPREF9466_01677 [Fusobacterium necrophorum subsp. funduliforme 1_1_36S]|nr:hypothetical protein HMPREF9466_01677 [Fusobacterium necrophorum subsp. funduliforme 1_1_36S]
MKIYKEKAPKGKNAIQPDLFVAKSFNECKRKCLQEIENAKKENREADPRMVANYKTISKIIKDLNLAFIK